MAKVLLFYCPQEDAVRRILDTMGVRLTVVSPEQMHFTLGTLEKGIPHMEQGPGRTESAGDSSLQEQQGTAMLGGQPIQESTGKELPGTQSRQESLLVMCDFSEKQMNRLLRELRSAGIAIDYKATLTSTNRNWSARHMYLEMAKERAAYEQWKRDKSQ